MMPMTTIPLMMMMMMMTTTTMMMMMTITMTMIMMASGLTQADTCRRSLLTLMNLATLRYLSHAADFTASNL
jgi:hypothetical protein